MYPECMYPVANCLIQLKNNTLKIFCWCVFSKNRPITNTFARVVLMVSKFLNYSPVESGLSEKWHRLFIGSDNLFVMKKFGNRTYKKFYAELNSGVQFKQEFHECVPVSVTALRYMFALYAALLSLAVVMVMVECKYAFLLMLHS